jgi:hypothetical protein
MYVKGWDLFSPYDKAVLYRFYSEGFGYGHFGRATGPPASLQGGPQHRHQHGTTDVQITS